LAVASRLEAEPAPGLAGDQPTSIANQVSSR
jgi:hypothetical protein